MVLCAFLCSGAPEDSTGSISGLNRPRDEATALCLIRQPGGVLE